MLSKAQYKMRTHDRSYIKYDFVNSYSLNPVVLPIDINQLELKHF